MAHTVSDYSNEKLLACITYDYSAKNATLVAALSDITNTNSDGMTISNREIVIYYLPMSYNIQVSSFLPTINFLLKTPWSDENFKTGMKQFEIWKKSGQFNQLPEHSYIRNEKKTFDLEIMTNSDIEEKINKIRDKVKLASIVKPYEKIYDVDDLANIMSDGDIEASAKKAKKKEADYVTLENLVISEIYEKIIITTFNEIGELQKSNDITIKNKIKNKINDISIELEQDYKLFVEKSGLPNITLEEYCDYCILGNIGFENMYC
jgi:hypothetical protein